MTGTRDKKVARSFEGLGVEFDPNLPSAIAKGFVSTNVQDAIVEAKSPPVTEPWVNYATKRFFHIQHKELAGVGGGDAESKDWAACKLNYAVIGQVNGGAVVNPDN